ncbi:hypothetical protein GQ457_15G002750 [Hibiscus cannabinus]
MEQTSSVKVVDCRRVSPPPGSVPTVSVPLTHLDISWLYSAKVQRLFFYEFAHPTLHFMETTLPMLQRSLSLTLQHFYPFVANIMCPRSPGKPYIHYTEGDSIAFTVAESAADFNNVIADYPRSVKLLHPFVPQLASVARVTEEGVRVIPIIAIQVTVFPNSGICIGSTYCHAVGDGSSFMLFMRCWKSVCRSGCDLTCLENSLPLINRDVIKDPNGMELIALKSYWQWVSSCENTTPTKEVGTDKVRATFVLGRAHAEILKNLVTAQCKNSVDSETYHISTFVVTCALIWVCLIKSKERVSFANSEDDNVFYYFLFPIDCRNRLEFPVPTRYLGNCLKPAVVDVKRSELIGEDGIISAAKAIGKRIKEMERSGLKGQQHSQSTIVERIKTGRLTAAAGSPKLQVYDTDFGWGKPCKVELTHIERDGAIALAECVGEQGGIEVGIALDNNQMDEFVSIFEQSLKLLNI